MQAARVARGLSRRKLAAAEVRRIGTPLRMVGSLVLCDDHAGLPVETRELLMAGRATRKPLGNRWLPCRDPA